MKMRMTVLTMFLLVCVGVSSFAGERITARLLYPKGGETFRPGDKVTLKWSLTGKGYCEQEIYLKVDRTYYQISPEMGASTRYYEWVVPNIEANPGILELRAGCADRIETKHLQGNNAFYISTGK